MPFSFRPYDPPPLSNLRERLLQNRLDRVSEYENNLRRSLEVARDRGLSPALIALNEQELENINGLKSSLAYGLEAVRTQDAAVAKTEAELRDALRDKDPLERSRNRQGLHRSEKSRAAAIEGFLQRERRLNAPLTREAFARAKAIAASRRYYDPQQSTLRGGRGYAYLPSASDLLGTKSAYDPCLDSKRVRREVMFAQRTAGRGYRGRHYHNPC